MLLSALTAFYIISFNSALSINDWCHYLLVISPVKRLPDCVAHPWHYTEESNKLAAEPELTTPGKQDYPLIPPGTAL